MDLISLEAINVQLDVLKSDSNGILVHEKKPPVWKFIYLLPIPFLCLGLCSNELVYSTFTFNTKKKSVVVVSSRPFYCVKKVDEIDFKNINSVGFHYTVIYNENRFRSDVFIAPMFITDSNQIFYLSDRIKLSQSSDVEAPKKVVMEFHRFIFEQQHEGKEYVSPTFASLAVLY